MEATAIGNRLLPSGKRAVLVLSLLIIFILSATIFQDFLHARRNHYSFYISESMLFNSFWLLFFPVSLLHFFVFRRIHFLSKPKKMYLKASLFVVLASVMHMVLFSMLVFGLSSLFFSHTYAIGKGLSYTLSQDFYKYLFVYGAIAYFHFRKDAAQEDKPAEKIPAVLPDKIVVSSGRKNLALNSNDIFFISASSPYISINTADKKVLHTETLKSISKKLDKNHFIRIHKSTIVNIDKIVSYKSRLNGDYDVILSNQQQLRLSRNYVNTFRQYFKNNSSSS